MEMVRLEKELSLSSWKVGEIDIWPMLKILILSSNNSLTPVKHSPFTLLKMLTSSFSSFCMIFFRKDKKKDCYIHFGDGNFAVPKMNNKDYVPQFIPYANEFRKNGISGILMERMFRFRNIDDTAFGVDFAIFVAKLFGSFLRISPAKINIPNHEKLLKSLNELGANTVHLELKNIKKLMVSFRILTWFYGILLSILKPKFVTLRCYYIRSKYPLIFVCRKRGIPIIDIQHGIQGGDQIAYTGWAKNDYNTLPDLFWVWRDIDAQNIQTWGGKAFVGGNLMLENFKVKNSQENLYFKKDIQEILPKNKKIVLISMQWGIEDYTILTKTLEISDEYFFLIRLHPQMSESQKAQIYSILTKYKAESYEVEQSSALPLYSLLHYCDLHITYYSAVIIEAASFGVPSIAMNKLVKEYFETQIEDGSLHIENNNLSELMKDLVDIKNNESTDVTFNSKEFFELIKS